MGMMGVQGCVAKNGSAWRHVCRKLSTNCQRRHLGRDSVWNVLSVTFTSPNRMRSGSCVVVHQLKVPAVAVDLQVRREGKK